MANFPPLIASSGFDLSKHGVPHIKSQTTLMNLVNAILFKKICGPMNKNEHLWVCTKFIFLHIPTSLMRVAFFDCATPGNSFMINTLHHSYVSGVGHALAFPVVVALNGMMSHISARNATMFLANIDHKSQKVSKSAKKLPYWQKQH